MGFSMPSPRPVERPTTTELIVVGASARAWSASAARAGWRVHAIDLFADRDLAAHAASATRLHEGYPRALPAAVALLPVAPVTYTGGLENHPRILAALARDRPLAGVGPAGLRHVRGPVALRRLARVSGMLFPETRVSPRGVPCDGSFLVKPVASAGGSGIAPWTGTDGAPQRTQPRCWQRLVAGRPYSASYVIATAGPQLIGVARQRLGAVRRGGPPFCWCGGMSLPAHRLPATVVAALARLGEALWRIDGLRGAIGVDFLVTAPSAAVLIEVNPRPTASLELHERQCGDPIAADHLGCFGLSHRSPPRHPPARPGCWAKALVRRGHPVVVDGPLLSRLAAWDAVWTHCDGGWPALADIPSPGDSLPAHGPVITVFAHGSTAAAAARALASRVTIVRDVLDATGPFGAVTRRGAAASPAPRLPTRTASGTRPRWCPDRSP